MERVPPSPAAGLSSAILFFYFVSPGLSRGASSRSHVRVVGLELLPESRRVVGLGLELLAELLTTLFAPLLQSLA